MRPGHAAAAIESPQEFGAQLLAREAQLVQPDGLDGLDQRARLFRPTSARVQQDEPGAVDDAKTTGAVGWSLEGFHADFDASLPEVSD